MLIMAMAAAISGVAVAPSETRALCADRGPLALEVAEADIVFVGRVLATNRSGYWATFAVLEDWTHSGLGQRVEVRGRRSPDAVLPIFDTWEEDSRTFEVGVTYLVLPYADGGVLYDSECTSTRTWTAGLAALRPADAEVMPVVDAAPPNVSVPLLIAAAVVGLIAVVSASALIGLRSRG